MTFQLSCRYSYIVMEIFPLCVCYHPQSCTKGLQLAPFKDFWMKIKVLNHKRNTRKSCKKDYESERSKVEKILMDFFVWHKFRRSFASIKTTTFNLYLSLRFSQHTWSPQKLYFRSIKPRRELISFQCMLRAINREGDLFAIFISEWTEK